MPEFTTYALGDPFPGSIGPTVDQSEPAWPTPPKAADGAPNVIVWILDDVGYAQLSPYGGPCDTPNIARVSDAGLRLTNFHTTALCSPTRACLLSGRNHHTMGMSAVTEMSMGFPAHDGYMRPEHGLLPEVLRGEGYNTFGVGKWHLTPPIETTAAGPFDRWPLGRGFERFYGFLGGDTDQWFPDLVQDNAYIEPPYAPEDGYHLNRDLADHSIGFIKDAHVNAPDKPFFLYFATGAGHAPHQVEPEWVEPYHGQFDEGWDVLRERVLARQIEMGIVPPGTELTARDPDVQAWDDLSDDAKRMYARQMEVYAGFLTQSDHHFGRVLDFVDEIGELDNTIVVVLSDNGASAEGGRHGTVNEALFFNRAPETLEDNLAHYDDWGGLDTFNHYSWGWTWAGNTPFRRWKRETYRGGISDPCVISWPASLDVHGEIRTQFSHVIDLAPTLLDMLGIEPPDQIVGIDQSPVQGTSLTPTFDAADSPEVRTTQYSEMFGHRSIQHEGWKAVCPFPGPSLKEARDNGIVFGLTEIDGPMLEQLDEHAWELYDLTIDPTEATNVAEVEGERLTAMIARWYDEAERYGVLPIAGPSLARMGTPRPGLSGKRRVHVMYPDAAPIPFSACPRTASRAHSITADVALAGGDSGILLSQGSRHGGFAFALLDGRPYYVHNYLGLTKFEVTADDVVSAGDHVLRYEFETDGEHVMPFGGKGSAGLSKLYVDGGLVAVGEIPYAVPMSFGIIGMSCGYDTSDSIDPTRWKAPFRFDGMLRRVTLDLTGELTTDDEAAVHTAMVRQ
jgi:arylsulfatase A-like enzyme